MRLSFIHRGGPSMASYRYRAATPAKLLVASINDTKADVLVFAKPLVHELGEALVAKTLGKKVIVDYCDDHFTRQAHYYEFLRLADAVTCNTQVMADRIKGFGIHATVIPEAYEYDECKPHCMGSEILWFGHATNVRDAREAIKRTGYSVRMISNAAGCIPWAFKLMPDEFARADIVILPKTADYKSANRAVEAIRQGCFVVAEPHPSLVGFPIWIGDLKEGIEWALMNPEPANAMTRKAQAYVSQNFSPRILESAWRKVLTGLGCTLEAEKYDGKGGPIAISQVPTVTATSANCHSPMEARQ